MVVGEVGEESREQDDEYENEDDDDEEGEGEIYVKSRATITLETDLTLMQSALAGKVWMAGYGKSAKVWTEIMGNVNKKLTKKLGVCLAYCWFSFFISVL